ncbi:MAG: Wzz/FepE/Etk N-terminal domain-containing protein [Bacteroidota bacterium]|nr:Wzz/FepE/Etk N-terminal domain-containing protein [Bacteroidota bacterium]
MEEIKEEDKTITLGATLLDFISILTKYRRFLVWFILSVTIITTVIAFISPKWYKATASVFPAEQADLFSSMDGISSLVKTFAPGKKLGSLTGPSETDRYIAILKSSTVLGEVIKKFDLVKVYDISSYPIEKTTKELLSNVAIEVQDEGNLTISVYDKSPQRAAEMANYFVGLLNKTNSELHAQNARGNREFIEQRYNQNLIDMKNSEEALKTFQKKFGVIAMPEQIEASIKAGAEIVGKLTSKEVELNIMKRTLSEESPLVATAKIEVQELQKKINEMNSGIAIGDDQMKILIPFKQAPELGAEYIRLYRNLEIQYKILQFITPLFEQAKVEERRSTPSVIVLDLAGVPERKAKPKVSLYVLMAFVISSVIGLFIIFTREMFDRLSQSNPEKYNYIFKILKKDWFGLKIKRQKE